MAPGLEKYLVPVEKPQENRKPRRRRRHWDRSAIELDGRCSYSYRHRASRLSIDSYSEMGKLKHMSSTEDDTCPTNLVQSSIIENNATELLHKRAGVSAMEFDSKGIYLASVTKAGCLTVHDFETLYFSIYGSSSSLLENDTKQVLHLSTSTQLDAIRWNPENQDELACVSRLTNKILIFDIGYISSEPVEVLEKGRSRFSLTATGVCNGLSDVAFTSDGNARLLASDLEGSIYIWDRRLSNLPSQELTTSSKTQLNSIQLDVESRVVFAASKHGIIYAWDLRGGRTSFAFQSHNEVYHPLLASFKLSLMMEKITSLKAQSDILPREIHSISLDPSCPYQLSFHLSDGWSGVLNMNILDVTHIHCPPPAWERMNANLLHSRKPSWLSTSSVYAVPCHSDHGIYLLDFHPDTTSACHVDFCDEDLQSIYPEFNKVVNNRFIPLSEDALVCAGHPLNDTIIVGTKNSSLVLVSQRNKEDMTD